MNILVVDDKPENSYLLEFLLKGNGFKTISAKNGAEALELAVKKRIDFIISDILMPVMDGFTFCRECKKNELLKDIPFIFYTATYTSLKDEEFALSLGANKFILKPQDPDVFIKIINEVLRDVKAKKIQPGYIPPVPEEIVLKEYNSALVRKLEDKMTQAEEAEKELREINIQLIKEIEEHRHAELKSERNEHLLKLFFKHSPAAVAMFDREMKYIFVSSRFLSDYGLGRQNVIGRSHYEIFPEIPESWKEFHRRCLAGETIGINEEPFLRANGKTDWIRWEICPWYEHSSEIGGIILFTEVITERRRMEEEAREAEERFKMVFENVFDGICIYSENPDPFKRELIDCNERYAAMTGRSREELLQLKNLQTLTITLDDTANNSRLSSLKEGTVYQGSFSWIRPDGKENVIEYVGRPILWHGKTYSIGIDRDITERKRSENELRKLSRVVEQSPVSIVITDTDGNIEYINPKTSETSGYQLEEVIGKNPRIFSSGEQSNSYYKALWNTIISGNEWRGELHNKKKNGELYWESASISSILNKKGVITNFIALKEDITERKIILKDLIAAKEEAEQSDKLKTEFLAQMSHEIRTPMNAIISFTDLLKDGYFEKITPELSDILNSITTAGRRIIRTVDLILDASEMQIGTYQPSFNNIDLGKKVFKIIQYESSALAKQKGVQLTFNNNLSSTIVYGDDYSVNQIFVNLIDNAIKYTNAGNVDVLIDRNKDKNIFVAVSDTGIGISEDYLPYLFEPFMQEERGYSRRYEGNGLGLSLVKRYCDLNGMTIAVESRKGAGSKFTVTFEK